MNRKSLSSLCSAVGLVVAGAIFASPAGATVTGTLNIANCTGGGVTVSGVAVTWLPPTLGGTAGCINVGAGTTLAYSGGALAPGTFGNILNLPAGPLPVDSFMTFVGTTLDFQLDGIGPANPSNGATCAGLGAGQSCVVALGSPFKLTLNGNGFTDVGLLANGRITDGTPARNAAATVPAPP